jgi:hypothetical protein
MVITSTELLLVRKHILLVVCTDLAGIMPINKMLLIFEVAIA